MDLIREILDTLSKILDYFDWAVNFLESFKQSIDNLSNIGLSFATITNNIKSILSILFIGGGAIFLIVILLAILIIGIGIHVFCSVPIYRIAKKNGKKPLG